MRLLLTLDFPPERGGIQRYLHDIVVSEFGPGDRVVVGMRRGGERGSATIGDGTAVERCVAFPLGKTKKWALPAMALAYLRLWRAHREGLRVECGNVYAALVPWLLFPLTRCPYSVYTYGSELLGLRHGGAKQRILVRVLRGAARLFALGRFTGEQLSALNVGRSIEIIPPRIDPPPSGTVPVPSGEGEGTVRLLAVGRLVEHKGHALLLEALGRLNDCGDVRCTIVGDGPYYEELRRQAGALGLSERVTLRREIGNEELEREYRRADVFVHPSRQTAEGVEGFGIVLLEAMAHGVPIVAAGTGGIPEVLDDGACGALVPPDDPDALAKAIAAVIRDPHTAQRKATHAYQHLIANYVRR